MCSDTPIHVQVFPFLLTALRIFTLLKQSTQHVHHCTVQSPGLTIKEYDLITWNIVLIYHACSLFLHVFKNKQEIPP